MGLNSCGRTVAEDRLGMIRTAKSETPIWRGGLLPAFVLAGLDGAPVYLKATVDLSGSSFGASAGGTAGATYGDAWSWATLTLCRAGIRD